MYILGTFGDDTLFGTTGNDHFESSAGDDAFIGGLGNDYYVVNSDGDQVVEFANQGSDTVVALVDYSLSANVENLFLRGNASFGAGNNSSNFIVGNAALSSVLYGLGGDDLLIGGAGNDSLYGGTGKDHLSGGAGSDVLDGGSGDDYYVVDNLGDQVVEAANAGADGVAASVNYTLAANVENLYLKDIATVGTGNSGGNFIVGNGTLASTLNGLDGNDLLIGGTGNDTLNGGTGNDHLDGGAGNDILSGGTGNDYMLGGAGSDRLVGDQGNDILTGGAGTDLFVYDNSVNSFADYGVDVITDFTSGQDQILLSMSIFSGLTTINFASVTSDLEATTSGANIVYNLTNGNLFFNQDAEISGFGSGGQFAKLAANLTLAAPDFGTVG